MHTLSIALAMSLALVFEVCDPAEDPEPSAPLPPASAPTTFVAAQPQHGGTIVSVGTRQVEIVPLDDGTVEAYLIGPAPADPSQVTLTVRLPYGDGTRQQSVALSWRPDISAYVGSIGNRSPATGPATVVLVMGGEAWTGQAPEVVPVLSVQGGARRPSTGGRAVRSPAIEGRGPVPPGVAAYAGPPPVPGGPRVVVHAPSPPQGPNVVVQAPQPPQGPTVYVQQPAPPEGPTIVLQPPPPPQGPRIVVQPPPPPQPRVVIVQAPPPPQPRVVVVRPPPPPQPRVVIVQPPPPPQPRVVVVRPPPPPQPRVIVVEPPRPPPPPQVVVVPGRPGRGHGHEGRDEHDDHGRRGHDDGRGGDHDRGRRGHD